MSQSPLQQQSGTVRDLDSPYATEEDWWFNERDEDGNVVESEDEEEGVSMDDAGTTKFSFAAHGLLKDRAPLVDPLALHEPAYAPSVSAALDQHHDPEKRIEAHEVSALMAWLFDEVPEIREPRDHAAVHHRNEEIELTDPEAFAPMAVDGSARGEEYETIREFRVNEEHGHLPSGPVVANRPIEELQRDIYAILEGAVLRDDNAITYETAFLIWERAMELKRDGGPHDQTIVAKVALWIDNPRLVDRDD